MADNTTLDPGAGGDTIRDKDRAGVKTPIVALDINPAGSEALMASAALADTTSNPTTAPWAGMLMCFNGTTWDRVRGDTTNGVFVNVKATAAPSSLPLPTGAATAAKQPALGTAGVASTDVITIQGIASGTVVPVSGTVTASGPLTDTQLRASAVPVDTELPAAAALADAASNPTAPATGGFGMLWNGATWDRAPGSAAGGATTNLKQLNGTTIATNSGNKDAGTQRVVIATDQVQLTNALKVDGSGVTQPVSGTVGITANSSVNVSQVAGTTTAVNAGTNSAGVQRVTLATDQTTLTNTFGNVGEVPLTAGGLTPNTYVSAASTNATSVKGSAGQVYGVIVSNINAQPRYLKIFNKATAPTVGTDTPVLNLIIPGNTAGAGSNVFIPCGVAFGTGIAFAITTGIALLDTGAVAANEITVNLLTK